jgi:hypothetical protein
VERFVTRHRTRIEGILSGFDRMLFRGTWRSISWGCPYRALRPISPQEAPLLRVVVRVEFLVHGFSNRDMRTALAPDIEADPGRQRQVSARVTRHLRLLRAHGLIKKVPRTHVYRITKKGAAIMTTAIKFRDTDVALLAA